MWFTKSQIFTALLLQKKKFITYCLSSESSYYNLLFVYMVYFLSIAFREFVAEWAVQFALI